MAGMEVWHVKINYYGTDSMLKIECSKKYLMKCILNDMFNIYFFILRLLRYYPKLS